MIKNLPVIQETQVWSLGWEDAMEKGMATCSSILSWRLPWTEEPGGLQSVGSQRIGHDWVSISALLTMPKPLTVWITINCGKFRKMGIPDHLTCLLRNLYAGRKQQLELDMEQQIGSKWEKEYVKAVYCHPSYLSSIQSTSWKMPRWMTHKLESRLLG